MKAYSIIFILAVAVIEISLCAPASESSAAVPFTPFKDRNVDELADYILKSTIHKFDAKLTLVVSRLKRFLEAMDYLVADAANDTARTKIYTEVRQSAQDTLRAIEHDTKTCGLYSVAMSKLGHLTKLVAKAKDSKLWNYWTLTNVDEKTLFVAVGYPFSNSDEHKASQAFFASQEGRALEAKTIAKKFIDSNCQSYRTFAADVAISN